MKIEQKLLRDLRGYKNNARTHSDSQTNLIAASIKEFGFTNPILIDAHGEVIAGHGRLIAAKKLGIITVPCTMKKALPVPKITGNRGV